MVKWIKLFGNQYLGFWLLGLLLFVIQEIPYMVMPLIKLETNPIMTMKESSMPLEMCEKALGSLCIAFMLFIVHGNATFFSVNPGRETLFFSLALGALLLNFFGWILYFSGVQSLFVMMAFIVALPPLFYVFIGAWRNNVPLSATGCVFFLVHFIHVWGNLRIS